MEPRILRCLDPKPADSLPILREELYRAEAHDFNLIRVDPEVEKPPHPYTAGDSFMLVLAGRLQLMVDGQSYDLRPGDLAFIPKGAVRGFRTGPEGATFFAGHLRG